MQEYEATPLLDAHYNLGEGCRWDEVRSELYWVDVVNGSFYRAVDEVAGLRITRTYQLDGFLSTVAPFANRDDGWVVGWNQSIARLEVSGDVSLLATPEARKTPKVRMNDGAADPWGGFYIGSMALDYAAGEGNLFHYGGGAEAATVFGHVTISNGLGWSPDRRTMYYIDSGPRTLHAFELDDHGVLGARRLVFEVDASRRESPDGLCVDAEGALWVAFWDGGEVRRYSPAGEMLARVRLPVSRPTCCAIGGANGTTLFVTTAYNELSEERRSKEPDAGRLFSVDVGVPGLALNSFSPLGDD
jgi:sugar lactone lactonase YvrE